MKVAVYGEHVILDRPAAEWLHGMGVQPGAIQVSGKAVYAVPHNFDAVRLFRNVGVELPTKLKTDGYQFPGKFTPYAHQLDTADFLAGYERAFCLNDPGTGKTASAIWAADYLMKAGVVRRVLVLCPLSCTESVWADELFGIAPHSPYAVLTGPKPARLKMLNSPAKWLVINHDGIKTIEKELASPESEIDLVIIDEATAFKTEGSDRSKSLKRIVAGRRIWAMTGTPIPQNPIDAHFICKLLNPDKTPGPKYAFQDQTMVKVSKFKWVNKANAADVIYQYMQPAVRYKKSDCLDMPEVVFSHRLVNQTPAQRGFIDDIKKGWMSTVNGHEVTAANAAIEMSKVLQALQGEVIAADGSIVTVDATPRLDACYDTIMESASKTVVFVPFKAPLRALEARLTLKGVSVAKIDGDTPASDRKRIIDEFQHLADPKVLLAHPKTASHGITLTAASTTIWYGPTHSGELFEQANNRTNRPGQKNDMRIVMLAASNDEMKIYRALFDKANVQQALLDMYKRDAK